MAKQRDDFAEHLRAAFTKRGLTVDDVAFKIWGVKYIDPITGREIVKNREQINAYLRGQHRPCKKRFYAMLDMLGIPHDEIPWRVRPRVFLKNKDQLPLDLPAPVVHPEPEAEAAPKTMGMVSVMEELIEALNRLTVAVNKLAE